MNDFTRRILALAAAIAAVILAAVTLIGHPTDPAVLLAWSVVCTASAVIVLAL